MDKSCPKHLPSAPTKLRQPDARLEPAGYTFVPHPRFSHVREAVTTLCNSKLEMSLPPQSKGWGAVIFKLPPDCPTVPKDISENAGGAPGADGAFVKLEYSLLSVPFPLEFTATIVKTYSDSARKFATGLHISLEHPVTSTEVPSKEPKIWALE